MTSLQRHLEELSDAFADQASTDDVVIAELGTVTPTGQLLFNDADLCAAPSYATRFEDLLRRGYPWINMSYYGRLDARHLVVIELPARPTGSTATSINYSGPSRRVQDADGDASLEVIVRRT